MAPLTPRTARRPLINNLAQNYKEKITKLSQKKETYVLAYHIYKRRHLTEKTLTAQKIIQLLNQKIKKTIKDAIEELNNLLIVYERRVKCLKFHKVFFLKQTAKLKYHEE